MCQHPVSSNQTHHPTLILHYLTFADSPKGSHSKQVHATLGDNVTLTCNMAALPDDGVTFKWTHTGENGTTTLGDFDGFIIKAENVSSNITLHNIDRFSYGTVRCTGHNSIGTGETQTFSILQKGEFILPNFLQFCIDILVHAVAYKYSYIIMQYDKHLTTQNCD